MNAATILMVIEIIKLIKAIKEGQNLDTEKRVALLSKVVKGNEAELTQVDKAVQDITPGLFDFLISLLK